MKDVELAAQWLNENTGKPLEISKWEKEVGGDEITDKDQVSIVLESISFRDSEYTDTDDYVASKELILHGRGRVLSKEGHFPLPQSAFEIPLTGAMVAKNSGSHLEIETGRTVYSIRIGHMNH